MPQELKDLRTTRSATLSAAPAVSPVPSATLSAASTADTRAAVPERGRLDGGGGGGGGGGALQSDEFIHRKNLQRRITVRISQFWGPVDGPRSSWV